MRKFILPVFILSLAVGCDQDADVAPSDAIFPSCVRSLMGSIEAEPPRSAPAQIWLVVFGLKTYYFVPADCCDQYSILYDKDCNVVCYPDGGIAGAGDGKCPVQELKGWKLLWEDKRK